MDSRDGRVREASLRTETQQRCKAALRYSGRAALGLFGQSHAAETTGPHSHQTCSHYVSCSCPWLLTALGGGGTGDESVSQLSQ